MKHSSDRVIAHVAIFLVILLGVYIHSRSPSLFDYKALVTGVKSGAQWSRLHIKVCPPFFFHDPHRDDRSMRHLVHETIGSALVDSPEIARMKRRWRLVDLNLDSELLPEGKYKPDGRCKDVTAYLEPVTDSPEGKAKGGAASRTPFLNENMLRIGVRDGQSFISERDPETQVWSGAAIEFGKRLAEALDRRVAFVRLRQLDSRITAIRYGVVDMTISLISRTPERDKLVHLSDTYYQTGLVLGGFAADPVRDHGSEQLNDSYISFTTTAGASGESYVLGHFPRARLVLADNTSEIPGKVKSMMERFPGEKHFFITDAPIARRWPGARVLSVDGRKLLTRDDEYVVAVGDGSLLPVVNRVIREERIAQLYARTAKKWQKRREAAGQ